MAEELLAQFDKTRAYCFELFKAKNADYGPTWLLYRPQSLNDEIWRKAKRIRTLEEHGDRACIHEGRDVEYVGIINYCIMFLIKLQSAPGLPSEADLTDDISVLDGIGEDVLTAAYQAQMDQVRTLLIRKNTDYGDAWKSMSLGAMTDQVIIRVYRIRKILANGRQMALCPEGVSAQLHCVINYCVFALIKMGAEFLN